MKDEDKREEQPMGELEGLRKRVAELEDMADKRKADSVELAHLFDLSVDMLCVADIDGYFRLINRAFEKTLGYTKKELLKEPFIHFVHPDDQASTMEAVKELSRGEPVRRFENRYQCKDGSYKWLAWSAMPVPEKGVTYAVAREITGLKQVEQTLLESELWMRSIFNSLEEAVFVVTPDRKMVNTNDAAERIFGYSQEELRGLSTEVLHVDHEHYLEFGRRIKEAFDQDKPANFEFECKKKNGEVFPTEHTVSLLKSKQGESLGIVSVVRDITERKQAEDTLQERTAEFQSIINSMAGREVRMAELKETIRKLREQMASAGMTPVADDPLKAAGREK